MRHLTAFGHRCRGFSLIELVIVIVIIAIIGAIAIPKMSRGTVGAGDSATIQDLAIMRAAVDLYNGEHPQAQLSSSTSAANLLNVLTMYSDVNGTTNATANSTCIYGPYLRSIPALPVGTNKNLNTLTTTGPAGTGSYGWFFDGTTFWANDPGTDVDASGKAYNTY